MSVPAGCWGKELPLRNFFLSRVKMDPRKSLRRAEIYELNRRDAGLHDERPQLRVVHERIFQNLRQKLETDFTCSRAVLPEQARDVAIFSAGIENRS